MRTSEEIVRDIDLILQNLVDPDFLIRSDAIRDLQIVFLGPLGYKMGQKIIEAVGEQLKEGAEPEPTNRANCVEVFRLAVQGGHDVARFLPQLERIAGTDPAFNPNILLSTKRSSQEKAPNPYFVRVRATETLEAYHLRNTRECRPTIPLPKDGGRTPDFRVLVDCHEALKASRLPSGVGLVRLR